MTEHNRRQELWALCQVLADPDSPNPWAKSPEALQHYILGLLSCGKPAQWVLVPDPPVPPNRALYSCTQHLPLMVADDTKEVLRCCEGEDCEDDTQTCMYIPWLIGLPKLP